MKVTVTTLLIASFAGLYGAMALAEQQGESSVPPGHPQIPVPQVGEDWPAAAPEDVESIDAIIKAFYEAPAGAPGQERDWDRFSSLFVPSARLIPARQGDNGTAGAFFLPVADYIAANKTYFEKGGFWDSEISRQTQEFGNIVHVWSTFESRRTTEDSDPYVRGINSIQLLRDADRYWIIGVFWDFERPQSPIPDEFLPTTEP
jgi:hypothetical protein